MRIAVEMIELFSVDDLIREQDLVREARDHALVRLTAAEPTERIGVELSQVVLPKLKALGPNSRHPASQANGRENFCRWRRALYLRIARQFDVGCFVLCTVR